MEAAIASSDTEDRGRTSRPQSATFAFRLRERVLRITTEDPWAAQLLRSTYAPMRCSSVVRAHELVFIPNQDGFAGAFYTVRNVMTHFAAQSPSCVALYAASIAVGEKSVLLLGSSGVGKSILALNLAYRGARFLGDETALVDLRSGEVCAVPRLPSLREPGLAYLLDEDARVNVASCKRRYTSERGRLWYALDFAAFGVQADFRAYPLDAVVLLAQRAAQAGVERVHSAQLLPAFAQRIHGDGRDLARIARLHVLLGGIRAYRVCIGPPADTADLLLGALRECA